MEAGRVFRKTGLACFEVPELPSSSSLSLSVCVCTHLPDCEQMSYCVCWPFIYLSVCVTVTNMTVLLLFCQHGSDLTLSFTSLRLHSKSLPTQKVFLILFNKSLIVFVIIVTAISRYWRYWNGFCWISQRPFLLFQHLRNTTLQCKSTVHTYSISWVNERRNVCFCYLKHPNLIQRTYHYIILLEKLITVLN